MLLLHLYMGQGDNCIKNRAFKKERNKLYSDVIHYGAAAAAIQ